METTRYFEEQVVRKRPYLRREWCERIIRRPLHRAVQPDGRIRCWGVVLLPDGETVLNALPDRNFNLPSGGPEDEA